jgi:hypothetical protein
VWCDRALDRKAGAAITAWGWRPMLTLVACPECASPAEMTDRFVLPSTAGRVGHVVIDCAAGHHFRMASDRLPVGASAGAIDSHERHTTE